MIVYIGIISALLLLLIAGQITIQNQFAFEVGFIRFGWNMGIHKKKWMDHHNDIPRLYP